jgi:hypothetical protein
MINHTNRNDRTGEIEYIAERSGKILLELLPNGQVITLISGTRSARPDRTRIRISQLSPGPAISGFSKPEIKINCRQVYTKQADHETTRTDETFAPGRG